MIKRRIGWSLALALVMVLASFAGTAPAATNVSCDNGAFHNPDPTSDPFDFSIMACRATPGDNVDFTLGRLQDGDIWEIDYNDASGSTGMIVSGVTDGTTSVSDHFQMPDIGGSDRDLEFDVYVLRNAEFVGGAPAFKLIGFGYVAAPGSTGGTGPTGTIGAPGFIAAPGAVSRGTTGKSSPSKKSKSKSNSGSRSKSRHRKAGSSPNKNKTPAPLAPQAPVSTPAPTPTPAPAANAATPQATPLAAPKPPGPAGPPGSPSSSLPDGPSSSPSSPTSPTTVAPIVPAANKSSDNNPLAVPVWLVVLLGLITLGGLGGAQMRMLGMWGPGPVPAGAEGQDPRLVALGRVAQSGASYQKRIADLKKAARDRAPVG